MKVEIILSSSGILTIRGNEGQGTFTSTELYKILKQSDRLFKKSEENSLNIIIEDKFHIDVPPKKGRSRRGEDYYLLYERIRDLGFTEKRLEHNIIDIQQRGIIEIKWRRNDMVHIPTFIMEASQGEVLQVLNFKR